MTQMHDSDAKCVRLESSADIESPENQSKEPNVLTYQQNDSGTIKGSYSNLCVTASFEEQ